MTPRSESRCGVGVTLWLEVSDRDDSDIKPCIAATSEQLGVVVKVGTLAPWAWPSSLNGDTFSESPVDTEETWSDKSPSGI